MEWFRTAFSLFGETERDLVVAMSCTEALVGVASFVGLMFVAAPYGKYFSSAGSVFGFPVNGRLAWILQETPSFMVPAGLWAARLASPKGDDGAVTTLSPNTVLLSLFLLHYLHRSFIFPFRIQGGKPTPVVIMLMALAFCFWNGYIQGSSLVNVERYPAGYMYEPNFVLGVLVMLLGAYINLQSDTILMNLRKPGDTGYYIPYGGWYEFLSAPNFFGEIVEWTGFAIAAWSVPAAAFAFFTFCNIGPRGAQHHAWYKQKFGDKYPRSRRAVIPFIW